MRPLILLSQDHGVARIVLSRPEALNALSPDLLKQMLAALEAIAADDSIRAVTLAGAGDKGFCAGADIAYLNGATAMEVRSYAGLAVAITRRIEALGKPVIAALHGYALGGGLEIAEACAIRVASDDALLGHPEVQIGAVAGFGGTTRLPRLIGKARAAEMLLTGRVISAAKAWQVGLVNDVVPRDRLAAHVDHLAREIARHAPEAVSLTWEAVHRGLNMTLEESAQLGADFFGLVASTDSFRQATGRWLQRRGSAVPAAPGEDGLLQAPSARPLAN